MIDLKKETSKLLSILNQNGYRAYIVGGCVRDYHMGITPFDIDIATDAKPDEVKQLFAGYRTIDTGIEHGTVTVIIDSESIEVTTFRIDSEYSDNRHPDAVIFTDDLKEDLSRRDFTMNAIAYNADEGIIDPFGGVKDIDLKIIRCVGDPDKRFKEDALRILRALRFSSVTGFDIEERTKKAIFANRSLLKNISMERVYVEITKMLCGKNIEHILIRYIEVIGVLIPEILILLNSEQTNKDFGYEKLSNTATAVRTIDSVPYLKYASLLHDIGASIAKTVLKRLKADNETINRVVILLENKNIDIEPNNVLIKKLLNRLGSEVIFDLLKLRRAYEKSSEESIDEIEGMVIEILERKECFLLKDLKISGSDITSLGIAPSKVIGDVLGKLLEMVIEDKLDNNKHDLLKGAKLLINQTL